MDKETGLMCVDCGKPANKGSMKHPYCEECFKKRFGTDINKYLESLHKMHGG